MKKTILFIVGIFAVGAMIIQTPAFTNSAVPPAARTGAPFEGSCASVGCHNPSATAEMPGDITILMNTVDLDTSFKYDTGQTYFVEFSTTLSAIEYGFQFTAVDQSNNRAGTLTPVNLTNTSITSFMGLQYLAHQNADTNKSWDFTWASPANNVGPVTFYYTINGANGNGSSSGDNVVEGSRTFEANAAPPSTGIASFEEFNFNVYPNPVVGEFFQLESNEFSDYQVEIFNINGARVFASSFEGTLQNVELPKEMSTGMYIMTVETSEGLATTQLIVQ